MRNAIAVTALAAVVAATGSCGGNKPGPNRVFLMPAPGEAIREYEASLEAGDRNKDEEWQ